MSNVEPELDPNMDVPGVVSFEQYAAQFGGVGTGGSVLGAEGNFTPQGQADGHLYKVGDANDYIASLTPDKLKEFQKILLQAGIIPSYDNGNPADKNTIAGYEYILTEANVSGEPPSRIVRKHAMKGLTSRISQAASNVANERLSGPTRAPFTARISNSDELRNVFKQAVISATGEDRGDIDIDRMVRTYQAMEQNQQADVYNRAPSGGVFEDIPSAETFAEDQIREAAPTRVEARDAVDYAGELLGMLGGPFNGGRG